MTCKNCFDKVESADILSRLLANTYTLYLKTHNVHWNVRGDSFREIHLMTEEQYTEMALAVDEIAERIRMVGKFAPASFEEFEKLSCIESFMAPEKSDKEMLETLLADHEMLSDAIRKMLSSLGNSDDFGTIDLLNARLKIHEKTVWMLKSTLLK